MYHLALSNKIRLLLLYFIPLMPMPPPPPPPPPPLLSEQCDKSLDHFYKGRKLNLRFGHGVQRESWVQPAEGSCKVVNRR